MKKVFVYIISFLMITTVCSTFLTRAEGATVRQWNGDQNHITEFGRNGVKIDSKKQVAVSGSTAETFDMNEGVTIKFTVNSIPGIQDAIDAWFGLFLQTDVSDNPEYGGTGFKFLFREADPDKGNSGMAIQRFIRVPDGEKSIIKNPLLSPVPMLGNEHYISIYSAGENMGFIVSIDGVIVNYYEDSDAFQITDLSSAHVVFRAYTSVAANPSSLPPWEVVIDEITPMTKTENWIGFGTSNLEETDSALNVVENIAKSGANQTIFYKNQIDVQKTTSLKLRLNQIPNYYQDLTESYIAVMFSTEMTAFDVNSDKSMICLFKVKDNKTLIGNCGQGSLAVGLDSEIKGVKPSDSLNVRFGFNSDGIAVLTVNNVVVGHSNKIKENNFINKKGYLSVVTANFNAENGKPNWSYSVSDIKSTDEDMPTKLEEDKPIDQEQPKNPHIGLIIGLSVGGGVILIAGAVLAYILITKRNKKKDQPM